MDYLTTVEAAKKWNISSRMAAYYCEAGRVKGAVKKGKSWLVPVSAEKPVDKRHFKKTVKHKDDRKRKGNGDLFPADHGGGTRHLQSTIPKTYSGIWDLPGKLCAIMRKSACSAPRETRGASTGNLTCMTCPA